MAMSIVSENLVEDLLYEASPEADAPEFDHEMKGLCATLQPALDQVIAAYQAAATTLYTERAFCLFLSNLISAVED